MNLNENDKVEGNLEIREAEIRSVDEAKRTVSGIAVPYGEVTNRIPGMKERVERGAFGDVVGTAVYFGHDHRSGGLPVGKITEARDAENGLDVTVSISKTPKGDEVYELLRDGTLSKFSVGFIPVKSRREGDVIVRESGILRELSIVDFPAYANASVNEVRSATDSPTNNKEDINMSETNDVNASEVTEMREAIGDLERKFAVLSESGTSKNDVAETKFRSGGEWLASLSGKNPFVSTSVEDAHTEVRAFTGLVVADSATRPAWVNEQLKLVEQKRTVASLFGRAPLPASGMTYVYPQVAAETGTIGVQAAEGNDLPYLEVTLTTATGVVKTYGGYTSISRQAIERTEPSILEVNLRHLYNQYGIATEKAVRDALVGATGTQVSKLGVANNAAGAGVAHGAATAKQWIANVFEAAALIEDNARGAAAEFVLVSRDVFVSLSTLVDSSGRPMFVINGDGVNSIGNVNVRGVSGNIGGFPVVVGAKLAANTMFVTSSEALTVREDATKSLQDENIINLTRDFSVYGYMGIDLSNPLAIVKVDVDGVA